jgi:hypothetical protein
MDSGDGPPGMPPNLFIGLDNNSFLNATNIVRALLFLEPIRNLRKTMTRTLRNFDSAGEDQLTSAVGGAGEDGVFDPPARERPAVS